MDGERERARESCWVRAQSLTHPAACEDGAAIPRQCPPSRPPSTRPASQPASQLAPPSPRTSTAICCVNSAQDLQVPQQQQAQQQQQQRRRRTAPYATGCPQGAAARHERRHPPCRGGCCCCVVAAREAKLAGVQKQWEREGGCRGLRCCGAGMPRRASNARAAQPSATTRG